VYLSNSTSHRLTKQGTGSPEGAVTALVGTVYVQTNASPATDALWYKATGTGNTGWVQVSASSLADGDKGDITVSSSGSVWNIDAGVVGGTEIATDVALAGNPTTTTQASGNSSTRVATTAFVADAVAKQPEVLIVAVSDETTALTTGTAKVTFRMPFAMTLTAVRASLTTTSSSGDPTVDINEGAGAGTTILSTKLSIDAGELTSTTAATPAVISDAALADDAQITIDIDTAGTGAAGLKVYLIGTRT
jgi:hypothetical protein